MINLFLFVQPCDPKMMTRLLLIYIHHQLLGIVSFYLSREVSLDLPVDIFVDLLVHFDFLDRRQN